MRALFQACEDQIGYAVQVGNRIDGRAVEHDLIMEMRARRCSRRPDECDVLGLLYVLPWVNVDSREMAIPRVIAVAMIDLDLVPLTTIVRCGDNRARGARANVLSVIRVEIDSFMEFGPRNRAPPKDRRDSSVPRITSRVE